MLEGLKRVFRSFITGISESEGASLYKGEGMLVHQTNGGEIILENTAACKKITIKNKDNVLTGIQLSDIDFDKVDLLENPQNAHKLIADYGFGIETFINGVALVWWTLYPDGRYFEDEDGFGGEACNETTVYAFMDTQGKVVIPFQDMSGEEKNHYRKMAEEAVKG
ncbi:hypothetical protein SDC9_74708 [bioreactor metagenome]|uniref:Uncharacterized protein n=1 Tax=bioreactor metagenome TaxID=1076179 RepID=A0A644YIN1_9ZZZZ